MAGWKVWPELPDLICKGVTEVLWFFSPQFKSSFAVAQLSVRLVAKFDNCRAQACFWPGFTCKPFWPWTVSSCSDTVRGGAPSSCSLCFQAMGMMVNAVSWHVEENYCADMVVKLFISTFFFYTLSCQSAVAAGLLISFLPRRKPNSNPEFDVSERPENWGRGSPVYWGMCFSCKTAQKVLTAHIFLGFKPSLW